MGRVTKAALKVLARVVLHRLTGDGDAVLKDGASLGEGKPVTLDGIRLVGVVHPEPMLQALHGRGMEPGLPQALDPVGCLLQPRRQLRIPVVKRCTPAPFS